MHHHDSATAAVAGLLASFGSIRFSIAALPGGGAKVMSGSRSPKSLMFSSPQIAAIRARIRNAVLAASR